MAIRGVLFDWDGTLARNDAPRAVEPCDAVSAYVHQEFGISVEGSSFDRALTAVMSPYIPGETLTTTHVEHPDLPQPDGCPRQMSNATPFSRLDPKCSETLL